MINTKHTNLTKDTALMKDVSKCSRLVANPILSFE